MSGPDIDVTVNASDLPGLVSQRLDVFLTHALGGRFSRQEIKRAIEDGGILLGGKPAKARTPVRSGDRIQGKVLSEKRPALLPETVPLKVLYEDESLLVIDKAAGMTVHPGAGMKKGTLVHALLGRGGPLSTAGGSQRPGIVHRLDKDTSGLLVVAKTNEAHRLLQAQFQERTFSKTYLALVKGRVEFEEGRLTDPIGRHAKVRRKMAVSASGSARDAETRYKVARRFRYATLLEVKIVTGRTHQIRVHMAHLGNPVVGDELYGTREKGQRLALHALKIGFTHPKTGKLITFESPVPDDLKSMIETAENQ
ncbi:MAG: RluA family pseudouridine synthase [Candidatus Omnitrophota bacterium]